MYTAMGKIQIVLLQLNLLSPFSQVPAMPVGSVHDLCILHGNDLKLLYLVNSF